MSIKSDGVTQRLIDSLQKRGADGDYQNKEMLPDVASTFINIYRQQGKLPVWHLMGNETDCMVGNNSASVVADAYLSGLRGYDAGVKTAMSKPSITNCPNTFFIIVHSFNCMYSLNGAESCNSTINIQHYLYVCLCANTSYPIIRWLLR